MRTLFALFLLSFFASTYAATCDQNFPSVQIRAGSTQYFTDAVNNRGSYDIGVGLDSINFSSIYGGGSPQFVWTTNMVNAGYIVNAGSYGVPMFVSNAYAVPTPAAGALRRSDAINIIYSINFYELRGQNVVGPYSHSECQPYEVTWCGDGVRDAGDGELCDLGAQNGQVGSSCSATCQPVAVTPPPVCGPTNTSNNTQLTQNSPNLCPADASVVGFTANGTNPINYSWTCSNVAGTSPACSASYTPPVVQPPRCEPSRTGTQTAPLSQGYCAVGSVRDFTATTVGSTINYTWTCYIPDDFSPSPVDNCTANYTPPTGPLCGDGIRNGNELCDPNDPSHTGWGTLGCNNACEPINNTPQPACNSLTATPTTGIVPVSSSMNCATTDATTISINCGNGQVLNRATGTCTYTTPGTYTARCTVNNAITNTACTTKVTVTSVNTSGFDLSIKKYVDTISPATDAQTQSTAITKTNGATTSYKIVVTNQGPASTSGTTSVYDDLPAGVDFAGNQTVWTTGSWRCEYLGNRNGDRDIICTSDAIVPSGGTFDTIDIPLVVSATSGFVTNIAFVHNPNENPSLSCLRGNTVPSAEGLTACTVDQYNGDPAVIALNPVNTGTGFDLSLKKYIGTDDAQTAPGGDRNTNTTFSYGIVVTNKGPQSSTGITTVQDILPAGVVYDSTSTGWTNGGWSCTYSGTIVTVKCTTSDIVASGANYTTILIPVKITAGANATVLNIAAVDNPYETGRCNADGSLPSNGTTYCTLDTTNSDPAYFHVPGGSNGGGTTYYLPTCVNGINSCSTQVHSSLAACNSYNPGNTCYSFLTDCNAAANTISCGGPGGCSGPYCYPTGNCGDGVLGSSAGEECDLGNANSDAPGSLCSKSCKLQITTIPGANPIKQLTISIPGFTNILGSSTFLRKPFSENNIIVGHNSNVFTLADVVSLDVDSTYAVPLLVPADREFCLKSTLGSLAEKTICQRISKFNTPISLNGSSYVVINGGYVQERLSDGTYRSIPVSGPADDTVTLMRGSDTTSLSYPGPVSVRLRDLYLGSGDIGSTSNIVLFNKNPITEPNAAIDLAKFQVKVSGVMVGGTSSTVNRSISRYFTPNTGLSEFLAQFSRRATTTTATTGSIGSSSTANINISIPTSGGRTVSTIADLEALAVNGNKNILALKNGDLTIACPSGANVFTLTGVRTLIVEGGNLILRCNIGYGSSDTTSSWAFIVKTGNIIVDNGDGSVNNKGITNLAGVYVAIPGVDTAVTGRFISNGQTTTAILRLNGSMYGNATPLFQSRLYVRGTNAYDILTTGVILSYSNRALVNPPPLLSSYLNNYSVSRVVR